jgi:sarcosine reductase
MSLVLSRLSVQEVRASDRSGFEGGVLSIDTSQLAAALVAAEPRLKAVTVHLAHPGDSARVLCVKDVIQPSCKLEGDEWGKGRRLLLDNVAVVTSGPIVGFQEGVIDMSGPAANHSPFSAMPLVILELEVVAGLQPHEHEEALRLTGQSAAQWLAERCQEAHDESAVRTEEVRWDEVDTDSALPKLAYVLMVLSQGLLHDTYVLGNNASQGLPIRTDPRVILDAGVTSGNCVSACDKNTSYHHRNNPVIEQLLAGHGIRWNFVGVVITNEPVRLADKQRSASATVELVAAMQAQGVVISKEGFGNPDADLMMIIRSLEQQGIRTVGITDEYAGIDGASQSLADTTPEADAIVSTGNANEKIVLPPMATTIGPLPDIARLAGGYAGSLHDDGSLEVELQAIIGATNQLGFSRLRCREV